MYKGLVILLRKKYDKAPLVMEAANVIEELTHLDYNPCWVSVFERLPDDGEDVLCSLRNDDGEVCATVGRYNSTFKLWELDAEWASSRHVTHWMPLPKMPPQIPPKINY